MEASDRDDLSKCTIFHMAPDVSYSQTVKIDRDFPKLLNIYFTYSDFRIPKAVWGFLTS